MLKLHNPTIMEIANTIEDPGAAVHSIDEVASGKRLVEEAETLQERTQLGNPQTDLICAPHLLYYRTDLAQY